MSDQNKGYGWLYLGDKEHFDPDHDLDNDPNAIVIKKRNLWFLIFWTVAIIVHIVADLALGWQGFVIGSCFWLFGLLLSWAYGTMSIYKMLFWDLVIIAIGSAFTIYHAFGVLWCIFGTAIIIGLLLGAIFVSSMIKGASMGASGDVTDILEI